MAGIAAEIGGFFGPIIAWFKPTAKPAAKPTKSAKAKPVAKKAYVNETQVMVDVVKHLTEFFRLQEQLAAHIREEEEKSKTVYDPNQNHMEAALKRVMALDQMAELEVTIRETMVYQSPPEMGALYSKVFKMRDTIKKEQEGARKDQEAKERYKAWRKQEARRQFLLKEAYLGGTAVLILYIWMWFLFIKK